MLFPFNLFKNALSIYFVEYLNKPSSHLFIFVFILQKIRYSVKRGVCKSYVRVLLFFVVDIFLNIFFNLEQVSHQKGIPQVLSLTTSYLFTQSERSKISPIFSVIFITSFSVLLRKTYLTFILLKSTLQKILYPYRGIFSKSRVSSGPFSIDAYLTSRNLLLS